MPYFTYDTSVIISRHPVSLRVRPNNLLLSSVVLMELIAGAKDVSLRKSYERLFRDYSEDDCLIIPSEDDWLLAGKVLYWLTQGRRRLGGGKLHRLPPGASQRMALDVLIAAGARRWNAGIVTENWKDFTAIKRFCDVKILRASDFFR